MVGQARIDCPNCNGTMCQLCKKPVRPLMTSFLMYARHEEQSSNWSSID